MLVVITNNISDTEQGIELIKQSFAGHSGISCVKQYLSIQIISCIFW